MENTVARVESAVSNQPRYWLIELVAFWEGRLTTVHLCKQFGLSRQQASKVISEYRLLHPKNLVYSNARKGYLPSNEFAPNHISTDVSDYLQWLLNPEARPSGRPSPKYCASLSLPTRRVAPEVIRALTHAMRGNYRLEVDYVSLSNPNRDGRIIMPHSYVNTGLRWHVRAWCEKSAEFRDFVLSRFRGQPELLGKSEQASEQDAAWQTEVDLVFAPDPRLTVEQRRVLEADYEMVDGHLKISSKACMINYLLQEMGVSTKVLDGTPEAQQLVLVNLVDIKPWLFS